MKNPQSSPYTHTGTNFQKYSVLCVIAKCYYSPILTYALIFFFPGDNDPGFLHCIYPFPSCPCMTNHTLLQGDRTVYKRTQIYWKESHFLFYVSFAGKWLSSSLAIFLPTEQPKPHTHTHTKCIHICIFINIYMQLNPSAYFILKLMNIPTSFTKSKWGRRMGDSHALGF